jgi:hypothetical protein
MRGGERLMVLEQALSSSRFAGVYETHRAAGSLSVRRACRYRWSPIGNKHWYSYERFGAGYFSLYWCNAEKDVNACSALAAACAE